MAYIEFRGQKSSDLGLKLINDLEHHAAKADVSTVKIKGRDGVLLMNNDRLEAVEQTFPFLVNDQSVREVAQSVQNWLRPVGWAEFIKSWEIDYVYRAYYAGNQSVKEVITTYGKVLLPFVFHPVKYLKSGLEGRAIVSGDKIENSGTEVARPVWIIEGDGDFQLTISQPGHADVVEMTNIEGKLIWDCNRSLVLNQDQGAAWDKVLSKGGAFNKPHLPLGESTITYTEGFTVKVVPNIGVAIGI